MLLARDYPANRIRIANDIMNSIALSYILTKTLGKDYKCL